MFNIFSKLKAKGEVKNYLSDLNDYCAKHEFNLVGNDLKISDTTLKRIYISDLNLENIKIAIKKHIGTDEWKLLNDIISFEENEGEVKNYLSDLNDYCTKHEFNLVGSDLEISDITTKRIYVADLNLENIKVTIKKHIGIDEWKLLNDIISFKKNECNPIFDSIIYTFEDNDLEMDTLDDNLEISDLYLHAYVNDKDFLDELRSISNSLSEENLEISANNINIYKLFFSDKEVYRKLRNPKYKLFETYIKYEEEFILEYDHFLVNPCSFITDSGPIYSTIIDEKVIIFHDDRIYELQGHDFKLVDSTEKEDVISKINNKFTSFKISTNALI